MEETGCIGCLGCSTFLLTLPLIIIMILPLIIAIGIMIAIVYLIKKYVIDKDNRDKVIKNTIKETERLKEEAIKEYKEEQQK